jgi:hypothetical protein
MKFKQGIHKELHSMLQKRVNAFLTSIVALNIAGNEETIS